MQPAREGECVNSVPSIQVPVLFDWLISSTNQAELFTKSRQAADQMSTQMMPSLGKSGDNKTIDILNTSIRNHVLEMV